MRIREIYFRDFRNFRGEHRISFVDPVTDEARQMNVIAGINGSGKTTVLQSIEDCLRTKVHRSRSNLGVSSEAFVGLVIEDHAQNFLLSRGHEELKGQYLADFPSGLSRPIEAWWLHFPAERRLTQHSPGGIEPPKGKTDWLFHFEAHDQWQGSLEQLWVWQNYLDLEAGTERTNLKPFVETVESILGEHRKIKIEKGRVTIPVHWAEPGDPDALRVRLDQLPSGEQQVLLLFGEIARRIKKGAVIAIDEPELSLHPTLQRLVVHQLRKLAREWDAQIILATHSLEILRSVHPSERIILDELQQPEPEPAAEAVLAE